MATNISHIRMAHSKLIHYATQAIDALSDETKKTSEGDKIRVVAYAAYIDAVNAAFTKLEKDSDRAKPFTNPYRG